MDRGPGATGEKCELENFPQAPLAQSIQWSTFNTSLLAGGLGGEHSKLGGLLQGAEKQVSGAAAND